MMTELKAAIYAQLKLQHNRVYHKKAPETALFPYLVYDVRSLFHDGEGFMQGVLDIDGWDNAQDTTALETLMSNIRHQLDKRTVAGDKATVTFYLNNSVEIDDEEPAINRRKQIWQMRIIEKG